MDDAPVEILLRGGLERAQADEVELVLASAGIASRVLAGPDGWDVLIGPGDAVAAARVLAEVDADAREPVEPVEPAPAVEPARRSVLGLVVAAMLLFCFAMAGARDVSRPSAWFDVGAAVAGRIRSGELWRVVTAMFLHADPVHLAGNLVANLVFVTAVGRALGSGLGGLLVLLVGAAANLLTATLVIPPWSSVGASSGTFAALGVVAGCQLVAWRGRVRSRRRAWLPFAAALALFGMLGVGERSDVFAHLFGVLLGLGAGAVAALSLRRRGLPRMPAQAAMATVALAVVGCSFVFASRHAAGGILLPWGR